MDSPFPIGFKSALERGALHPEEELHMSRNSLRKISLSALSAIIFAVAILMIGSTSANAQWGHHRRDRDWNRHDNHGRYYDRYRPYRDDDYRRRRFDGFRDLREHQLRERAIYGDSWRVRRHQERERERFFRNRGFDRPVYYRRY